MNDADLTGRVLGGFRILRKLGAGGMAVVYKAHEESLNRPVALKIIHEHLARQPEFVARFRREARAAAQLAHPNIVQIYAVGEAEGVPYFSMEYVPGSSLQSIIEEEGFLTARKAGPILLQAAQALAAAHQAGIVHRDIKPSNIMIDAAGRAKVTDFGIAQMSTENRLTQTGMLLGTPGYTSPEQCLGHKLDARSDIYSLGVTAYEMLTGHAPFHGDTPAALILQIVDGHPPPLEVVNPTVPPSLRRIVEKMMHKDPTCRFQSIEDVAESLAKTDLATVPMALAATPRGSSEGTLVRTGEEGGGAADRTGRDEASISRRRTELLPEADADGRAAAVANGPHSRALVPVLLSVAAAAVVVGGWRWWADAHYAAVEQAVAIQPESAAQSPALVPQETTGVTQSAQAAQDVDDAPSVAVGDSAQSARADAGAAAPPEQEPEPLAAAASRAAAQSAAEAALEPPARSSTDRPVEASPAPATTPSLGAQAQQAGEGRATPVSAPPERSIVSSVTGQYEHIALIAGWLESAFIGAGYDVIALVPPNRNAQDVARLQLFSTVRLSGARQLVFFGRTQTQETVGITAQVVDLVTGRVAAGPVSTTVDYTSINLETQLREGAEKIAVELLRDLAEGASIR